MRRVAEVWAFGFAATAAGYMTWQFASFAYVSLRFHEVSTGVVRVPLAYPQAVMALGAGILTVALIDELVLVFTRGRPSFRAAEEAIWGGEGGLHSAHSREAGIEGHDLRVRRAAGPACAGTSL